MKKINFVILFVNIGIVVFMFGCLGASTSSSGNDSSNLLVYIQPTTVNSSGTNVLQATFTSNTPLDPKTIIANKSVKLYEGDSLDNPINCCCIVNSDSITIFPMGSGNDVGHFAVPIRYQATITTDVKTTSGNHLKVPFLSTIFNMTEEAQYFYVTSTNPINGRSFNGGVINLNFSQPPLSGANFSNNITVTQRDTEIPVTYIVSGFSIILSGFGGSTTSNTVVNIKGGLKSVNGTECSDPGTGMKFTFWPSGSDI